MQTGASLRSGYARGSVATAGAAAAGGQQQVVAGAGTAVAAGCSAMDGGAGCSDDDDEFGCAGNGWDAHDGVAVDCDADHGTCAGGQDGAAGPSGVCQEEATAADRGQDGAGPSSRPGDAAARSGKAQDAEQGKGNKKGGRKMSMGLREMEAIRRRKSLAGGHTTHSQRLLGTMKRSLCARNHKLCLMISASVMCRAWWWCSCT